jgi:hypothetical protein
MLHGVHLINLRQTFNVDFFIFQDKLVLIFIKECIWKRNNNKCMNLSIIEFSKMIQCGILINKK